MLEVRLNLYIMEMQGSNNIIYTIYYFTQKSYYIKCCVYLIFILIL
jgi:hypothetical protein